MSASVDAEVGSTAIPVPPSPDAAWRGLARVVLGRWCRVVVEGTGRIPASGGVIVAANHTSHGDSIALGLAFRDRALTFVGDQRLLGTPVLGRWLPTFGMVPLRRGEGDLATLSLVADLLAVGHAVVVFPEGSRSRDGAVHRPRSGVARLAAATGAPVLPVGLSGISSWWPVGHRPSLVGGRAIVRIGRPLPAPADQPGDRRTFTAGLHHALVDLAGAPRSDDFAPIRTAA